MKSSSVFNKITSIYAKNGFKINKYKSYRGDEGAGFYIEKNGKRIGGVSIGEIEIELLSKIVTVTNAVYTYNIGVAFGISTLTFALASDSNFVIGIDNFSENNQDDPVFIQSVATKILSQFENIKLFIGTSPFDNEQCMKNIPSKLSIVFIDGDHTESAATLDFLGVIPFIDEKSIIIWHDIDKIPRTFEKSIEDVDFFDTKMKLSTWGRLGVYFNAFQNKPLLALLNKYQ